MLGTGATPMNLYIIRQHRNKLEDLKERIERLRAAMEMGSRQLQLAPVRSGVRDKLADDMAKLDELERQYVGEVAALELEIRAAEGMLTALPEQQRTVVRLRYIEGLSWRLIARRTHYSERYCLKIHRAALKRTLNDTF
jgi:DNA-directed RNA polymerase specialized sigma24 family protein